MNRTITPALLAKMEANYQERKDIQVLSRALSETKMLDAAFVPQNAAKLRMDFSITVPTTGITWQKQSGRCWMFATMNMARERVVKKCNLKEFALSGTYLAFYDKLEKANNFFEAVLHYADLPVDARENEHIFKNACADGGQWDMAVGLMQKYGVVPDWVMPETVHSTGTSEWREIVTEQLNEYGLELRELYKKGEDTEKRREEMLCQMYNTLCILYGAPVKEFDFAYTDKDGVYHCDRHLTPKSFFETYIGDDLDDYVCLISSPLHELHKTYDQPYMGDVIEHDFKWLNVTMDELEEAAIAMLRSGEGAMFSCDCRCYKLRDRGLWDQDSLDYSTVLGGMPLSMTKEQKLLTKISTMNHCMYLCGVNIGEDEKPDRWKIENSWGEKSGQKGYFICSEKWFREYVQQVIVRKSCLTKEQLELFKQEPIAMTFWDPLA